MTNKELFASMQGQLKPSPQARAALEARLAQPVKKRPAPWKYGAVAACAALVLAAWPIYRVLSPALHAVVPGQGGLYRLSGDGEHVGRAGGQFAPAEHLGG